MLATNNHFRTYWLGASLGDLQSFNSVQGYVHHHICHLDVQLVSWNHTNLIALPFLTLFASIIGLVTPDMLDTITWGTYIFFAAFALIAFIFTFFCIPETRGKV